MNIRNELIKLVHECGMLGANRESVSAHTDHDAVEFIRRILDVATCEEVEEFMKDEQPISLEHSKCLISTSLIDLLFTGTKKS